MSESVSSDGEAASQEIIPRRSREAVREAFARATRTRSYPHARETRHLDSRYGARFTIGESPARGIGRESTTDASGESVLGAGRVPSF